MAQNRPPPAYMEYAAASLANRDFRILSLAERGLYHTIRLECWVNGSVPSDAAVLARMLGFTKDEVESALASLGQFFTDVGGSLVCPELEDYRAHLAGIREKQSKGGKVGAAMTNDGRKPSKRKGKDKEQSPFDDDPSNPRVTRNSTRESLVQFSSVQFNPTQPPESDVVGTDTWLSDYEKASNGY